MEIPAWVNSRYEIARRERKACEYIRAKRIKNIKEMLLAFVICCIPIIFVIVLLRF